MSHHHVREVCEKCGTVLIQCRCVEPKVDTPKGLCKDCASMTTPSDEGLRELAEQLFWQDGDDSTMQVESVSDICAKDVIERFASALKQVRRETREECARVAEKEPYIDNLHGVHISGSSMKSRIVTAIRALEGI